MLFAILLIGASYLIGQLTAGQDVKIIKDLGLAATSIFGLFIAVFIGIGLVSKEVERRSIYSLLAKPIHRYQLMLGKYAGLVLTLAVNLAVMAVALYAVLAYMAWGSRPDGRKRAGTAPALDPRAAQGDRADLRRADARHGDRAVLLDLLDADAVGGAHLRALRRRPLQRRPAELRPGRRFAGGGARWRAALYWVLPNLAPFDVKAQVVHGAAGAGRLHGADRRLRRCSTSRRCSSPRRSSSRAATSSRWPRDPSSGVAVVAASSALLIAGACRLQAARERAYPPPPVERGHRSTSRPAAPLRRLTLGVSTRWPPTSTGSARSSTTAAPSCAWPATAAGRRCRGRTPSDYDAAVSAARSDDLARSALQHRLPVRRDLSGRAATRRARPARPGDRAARKGIARPTR